MSYEKKEIICLGRSFHPGMLYDCRSDELIPTLTLWNLDKLNNAMNSRPKPYTNYELITEDTLSEKSLKLGVDASLKLSFLGGMISVSGSAHYLNDRKKSSKQERLTLKYSSLSRFDALSMDHLGPGDIQHPQIFETGDATHVVIAVEYGTDAIFVLDRDVGSNEDQHEVSGSLKVAMNYLSGGIEGEAKVTLGEGEKISYEKIRCTFYGDVKLDRSPSNLIDAIQVYQELPKTIEKCGPVPKKAWLYPLAKLDSKAARLVREISLSLVNRTEMILEKLHEAGIKAEDILQLCHPIFENQKQHIKSFRHSLDEFKIGFQKRLLPILPQIRGGGMEEEKLADLLKEMLNSPFSPDKLKLWLDGKKDEIELLNDYFNQLKEGLENYDVPIKITRTEADKLLNDINCDAVVGFAFNVAMKSDLFLNHMHNYLQNNLIKVEENVKPQFLHQDVSVKLKIRKIMRAFIKFIDINCNSKNANANMDKFAENQKLQENNTVKRDVKEDIKKIKYMVYAEEEDMGKHYACIILHNLADGTKTEFMPPSAPKILPIEILEHPLTLTLNSADINILLKWEVSEEGFEHVNSYIVQYMLDTEEKEWNKSEIRKVNNNKKSDSNYIADIILGLKPGKTYIFRVCSASLGGISEFSEPESIKLTPVSTPPPPKVNRNLAVIQGDKRDSLIVEVINSCKTLNESANMLYHAPLAACLVQSIAILSSCAPDPSLITKDMTADKFKRLTTPASFRASLCQVVNNMYNAFQTADYSMNTIRASLIDLPDYFSATLEIVGQNDDQMTQKMIAKTVSKIDTASTKCKDMAEKATKAFDDVLLDIDELCLASVVSNTTNAHEIKELKKLKADFEIKLKAYKDDEKELEEQYKAATVRAKDALNRNRKELTDVIYRLQNIDTMSLELEDVIKYLCEGINYLGKVKQDWKHLAHFFSNIKIIIDNNLNENIKMFIELAEDDVSQKLMLQSALKATGYCIQVSNCSEIYAAVSQKYVMPVISGVSEQFVLTLEQARRKQYEIQNSLFHIENGVQELIERKQEEFRDRVIETMEVYAENLAQALTQVDKKSS